MDTAAFRRLWPGTPSHAHTRLDLSQVITCSYLQVHKDVKEGTIYYIKQKKKAIISTYCLAGIRPTLEICHEKGYGSMQDMYLVTHDTNEVILALLGKKIM